MLQRKLLLIICAFLQFAGFAQEKIFPVPKGNAKQLFYLQRTSNTNTIVYELNYKNGTVDVETPIHEYWIRYQEKGQQEELSYIQRKFAYGIKAKKIAESQYELAFVSYKKFKMYLRPGADKKLYVFANINQKVAILTSIFIKINGGSFWSPNIEYVEVSGIDPATLAVTKERLII